ncbi:hypothetical protein HBA53_23795 (plasmid) [Rhodococcus pyridinivorans]|uniref:hypothetical protein n=1 Tax=Rhodococcus TaxID=1827 RepID=UPI001C30F18A|nr:MULTISPECIES: hypothetical protein [Rhodococcus]MBX4170944.1 hypothetical protein [Rhodococcus sp. DMU2021]QXF84138.1 hypothetical protein HBA53_23795 [Rhodococcus pyridinivorans]
MVQFSSDPERTRQRIADLDEYMTRSVYGTDGFVCRSATSCSSAAATKGADFYEGQLSHVGLHYDMFEDGSPLRVLVLGLEMGRPDRHVSLEARRLQQDEAIRMKFGTRHAHMLGTTSALRVAFGRPLGADRAGELLSLSNDPVPQHVMQCYALVNKRLCSAVRPVDSAKGRRFQAAGVPSMDRACLPHLAATVRILEPTLVILQSTTLRSLIKPHLAHVERIASQNEQLEYAQFAGVPTTIASFSHPAAHAPKNWGSSHRNRYAIDVVEPTLMAAREFILG